MGRIRTRTVEPPEQSIEPLLHFLLVASRLAQSPQQLGNHLLEYLRIVGKSVGS